MARLNESSLNSSKLKENENKQDSEINKAAMLWYMFSVYSAIRGHPIKLKF